MTRPTTTEERRWIERITGALPRDFVELEALCSIARLRFTREIETAAVTCGESVELLISLDFLREHIRTDEELAVLVLHEIYHVLLGHARVFRRFDFLTNIAQDAVINAMISLRRPEPEVTSLFRRLYRPDRLPDALLRPPRQWPGRALLPTDRDALGWIQAPALWKDGLSPREIGQRRAAVRAARRRLVDLVNRLYPVVPRGEGDLPTVAEVREELASLREVPFLEMADWEKTVLLGQHGEEESTQGGGEGLEVGRRGDDWLVNGLLERIRKDAEGRGVGLGTLNGHVKRWRNRRLRASFRRKLRQALKRAVEGASRRGVEWERLALVLRPDALQTPLPHPHDRTQHAKRKLMGRPPSIYKAPGTLPSRHHSISRPVLVYIDVSGSMGTQASDIAEAVRPFGIRRQVELFAFSNVVSPITLEDLRERRFVTGFGTLIEVVFWHLLRQGRRRKALVISDGIFGDEPDLATEVQRHGIEVHLALTSHSAAPAWLRRMAASVTDLPFPREELRSPPFDGGVFPIDFGQA